MPPTIRPARPEDAAAILALILRQAAFEGAGGTVALTEDTIRADAFGPGRRFEVMLAEQAGIVVGLAVFFDSYSSWAGRPALMLHDLFVDHGARGAGIGRLLLAAVAREARERGCCRMDVNVLAWNAGARRFYEGLGFSPLADWVPHRLEAAALLRLAGTAD